MLCRRIPSLSMNGIPYIMLAELSAITMNVQGAPTKSELKFLVGRIVAHVRKTLPGSLLLSATQSLVTSPSACHAESSMLGHVSNAGCDGQATTIGVHAPSDEDWSVRRDSSSAQQPRFCCSEPIAIRA